jgi:hypothetical protein
MSDLRLLLEWLSRDERESAVRLPALSVSQHLLLATVDVAVADIAAMIDLTPPHQIGPGILRVAERPVSDKP